MKNIGDGTLEIPIAWHDSSINIFTAESPGDPGPSLTINRDRLPPGVAFHDYTAKQLQELSTTLSSFTLREAKSTALNGQPAQLYEFTWEGEAGAIMHQILLTTNDDRRVLNLVATHSGIMDVPLRQQMLAILLSFRLTPPSGR